MPSNESRLAIHVPENQLAILAREKPHANRAHEPRPALHVPEKPIDHHGRHDRLRHGRPRLQGTPTIAILSNATIAIL